VRNVPCAVTFLVSTQVGDIGLLPVSLAAPTWSNELVVDSNVWRAWLQWLLFIIFEDSDDDSNLSDDFDEIKN